MNKELAARLAALVSKHGIYLYYSNTVTGAPIVHVMQSDGFGRTVRVPLAYRNFPEAVADIEDRLSTHTDEWRLWMAADVYLKGK